MRIGIDEVGRGSLAGPLIVGAVVEENLEGVRALFKFPLKDSKKLTRIQRETVYGELESRLCWAVGEATNEEIDRLGLSAAIKLASGRALFQLPTAQSIIADAGLRHPLEKEIPTEWFVKGDELHLPIMLASIMAKVWRDSLMREWAVHYPYYGFESNVGYGSRAHREVLRTSGLSPLHRRSFCKNLA